MNFEIHYEDMFCWKDFTTKLTIVHDLEMFAGLKNVNFRISHTAY